MRQVTGWPEAAKKENNFNFNLPEVLLIEPIFFAMLGIHCKKEYEVISFALNYYSEKKSIVTLVTSRLTKMTHLDL